MASLPKTKTTNRELFDLIRDLKKLSNKTGEGTWRAVAEKLSVPASRRAQINLRKIEKVANANETVLIPGKILGDGLLTKKVTIVAVSASESAKAKIEKAGAKFVDMRTYISGKADKKAKIIA